MMTDPLHEYQNILGQTFVRLQSDSKYALIRDGKKFITKYSLGREYGVGNYNAARKIKGIMDELGFSRLEQIFAIPAANLADMRGVGNTTLFVLLCIAKTRGIDVATWYKEGVTFNALKDRAHAGEAKERKEAKARKSAKTRSILKAAGTRRLKAAESNGAGESATL